MSENCPVKVGETVPDFELETFEPGTLTFGRVSLDEMMKKGKWTVLVFYPADYSFVCPTELADLAALQEEIAAAGAEIISVSTDTKFVHLAWQREERLLKDVKYRMASDPSGRVCRIFGVYDSKSGLALRGTFIVSPEGILSASEVNYYNAGRNAAELLRKIRANVYLAEHSEEACPANWQPGGKTLSPGTTLVGRVGDSLKGQ